MVLAVWNQQYEPVADNLALSALVAALPVIILLGLLGLLKVKAHNAALAGLATAFLVALLVYGMPAPDGDGGPGQRDAVAVITVGVSWRTSLLRYGLGLRPSDKNGLAATGRVG